MRRKYICLILAVLSVGCLISGCKKNTGDSETTAQIAENSWSLTPPSGMYLTDKDIVDVANTEDAVSLSGVKFVAPNVSDMNGMVASKMQVLDNSIIQTVYTDNNGKEIIIRKGLGSQSLINGDNVEYDYHNDHNVVNIHVNCAGKSEDSINFVSWIDENQTYAIMANEGMPMAEVDKLVQKIHDDNWELYETERAAVLKEQNAKFQEYEKEHGAEEIETPEFAPLVKNPSENNIEDTENVEAESMESTNTENTESTEEVKNTDN